MNARISARCGVAILILGGNVAVLTASAPRVLAQAQAVPPPPPGAQLPWSPRPPGVPPDRWIPINPTLGIVIVHPESPLASRPGYAVPQSIEGYFAVRHTGRWWRLLTAGASLTPLGASSDEARTNQD